MSTAVLTEAYQRLHHAGPEWGADTLTNHGPMVVEVLVRRGRSADVHGWLDRYLTRLDDLPPAGEVITDRTWPQALGDSRRIGDWTAYFTRQVAERPWRRVLVTWWPRLLPGIVAGATHGVIRVGHAVRALLAGGYDTSGVTELAHGLAFWAARFQPVPGAVVPAGQLDPAAALDRLPRLDDQRGTVAARFARLAHLPGWTGSVAALRAPSDPDSAHAALADLVAAATLRYLSHGHGSPVLLVHTATAPNAVLRTLPALPRDLWIDGLAAAWAASAALTCAYAPTRPAAPADLPSAPTGPDAVATMVDRAVAHRDEHAIKLADTAADVYERTDNPLALATAIRATQLIAPVM
jgi:Questin oxidase-like